MNLLRRGPVLPCSMEEMGGGVIWWLERAGGDQGDIPRKPTRACAAPSPAVHTTDVTWQVHALALAGVAREPLGIAGKEKTFGFTYKMGWG